MRRKTAPRAANARIVQPQVRDAYRLRRKPQDIVVCEDCGLVHQGGRWRAIAPRLADQTPGVCPACRRVRERYPACTVRLAGMPAAERDEVLRLIDNLEARERSEHPLERLMGIEDREGAVEVNTTGLHLARGIATALRRRYHDRVAVHHSEQSRLLVVEWRG